MTYFYFVKLPVILHFIFSNILSFVWLIFFSSYSIFSHVWFDSHLIQRHVSSLVKIILSSHFICRHILSFLTIHVCHILSFVKFFFSKKISFVTYWCFSYFLSQFPFFMFILGSHFISFTYTCLSNNIFGHIK